MIKKQSSYDTVFIVNSTLGAEGIAAIVEKFTSLIASYGTIKETNEWGVKHLAYPIQDMTEGFYVNVKFDAPTSFPAELDRIFKITDGILRSLTINVEE